MSSNQESRKTIGQKAWITLRFVFFGFVGFWVMLGFTVAFASRVFEHDQHFVSPFLSLPLAFVGAMMMLYGVGEWGRWAYLWVFLSIPISVCLCAFVPGEENSKELPVIFAGLAAFFTCAVVRAYYALGVRDEVTEDDRKS